MGCKSNNLIRKRLSKKVLCILTICILFVGSSFFISFTPNVNAACMQDDRWEDTFANIDCIDSGSNYKVDIIKQRVEIDHTHSFWKNDYLNWDYLRIFTINSNKQSTEYEVPIRLQIDKDEDMRGDYYDIIFLADSDNNGIIEELSYWVENRNTEYANVWIKLNELRVSELKVYMLYGNENQNTDVSSFIDVFGQDYWNYIPNNDLPIDVPSGNTHTKEPNVCYGTYDDETYFLVTWVEGGANPYTQVIKGSVYDDDGNELDEVTISDDPAGYQRNNNPYVEFGDGKWFVAWEHYQAGQQNPNSNTKNIRGRIVYYDEDDGLQLYDAFYVKYDDEELLSQSHPHVVFDNENNNFLVTWTHQANFNIATYQINGILYDSVNLQHSTEKELIDYGSSYDYQSNPWVAFDPINEEFMIAFLEYDYAEEPSESTYSIRGKLFDENLDPVSSDIKNIKQGTTTWFYHNPCIGFCKETQRYLVSWEAYDNNDHKYEKIQGAILDEDGGFAYDAFDITTISNTEISSNIIPYLTSNFIVAYRGYDKKIVGRIVNTYNKEIQGVSFYLSHDNTAEGKNPNMGVYKDKVFVAWEDYRNSQTIPDIYGNLGYIYEEEIADTYTDNDEIGKILSATVVSELIAPDVLDYWNEFNANFVNSQGSTITFDILDENHNIIQGYDNLQTLPKGISTISEKKIHLRANMGRLNPSDTPYINSWTVTFEGEGGDGGGSTTESTLEIEYDNPKDYYKEGDKVGITAILSMNKNIDPSYSIVNITIEDADGTVLLDSWYMANKGCTQSGEMVTCSYYYEWTVNGSDIALDGPVTVTISVDSDYEEISIVGPNYDDNKNIDNTDPIIEGPVHITGLDSAIITCSIDDSHPAYAQLIYGQNLDEVNGGTADKMTVSGGINTFILSDLEENTTYYYKITVYDLAENFDRSTVLSFTTGEDVSNEEEEEDIEQHALADAGGPYYANVDEKTTFDGSGSKSSPNGIVLVYKWDFDNDGVYDRSSVLPTVTHSYLNVGSYTAKLHIEDSNGETSTDTASVFITESNTVELENLTSDNKTTIDIPGAKDTIILYLEVIPAANISNVDATIVDHGLNKPDDVPKNPTIEDIGDNKTLENMSIFRFVNITLKSNDAPVEESNINKTEIVFKVKNEWIEDNEINKTTITMLRYHNNSWQKLNTTYLEPANPLIEYSYFLSTTSGFSTFAVVGSKVVEKGKTLDKPEDEPIPWPYIIGFIIAAVVALIIILFKTKLIYVEEVEIDDKKK